MAASRPNETPLDEEQKKILHDEQGSILLFCNQSKNCWAPLLSPDDKKILEHAYLRIKNLVLENNNTREGRARLFIEFTAFLNLIETYAGKHPHLFNADPLYIDRMTSSLSTEQLNAIKKQKSLFNEAQQFLDGKLLLDPVLNSACFSLRLKDSKGLGAVLSDPVRFGVLPALFIDAAEPQVVVNAKQTIGTYADPINMFQSQMVLKRILVPARGKNNETTMIDTVQLSYPNDSVMEKLSKGTDGSNKQIPRSGLSSSGSFFDDNNNNNNNMPTTSTPQKNSSPDDVLHLVFFLGNAVLYEQVITDMMIYAQQLHKETGKPVQITAFNYPGVVDSEGNPTDLQHLIRAGKAVVQSVIDKGADPNAIVLYGESLGGVVATAVAKELHDDKRPVNLFNSRSLWSTSKYKSGTNNPFAKTGMGGWDVDAVMAYNQIPSECKDYILVKNPKHRPSKYSDEVIRHEGSLYAGLKATQKKAKHPAPGFEPPREDVPGQSKWDKKQERKTHKLVASSEYAESSTNLHSVSLSQLTERPNQQDPDIKPRTGAEKLIKFCVKRFNAAQAAKQQTPTPPTKR